MFVYVADNYLHCIQKFTLNGQFVSQFGSEGTAEGQFKDPHGLAFSQSKLLFVCDCNNHRIQVFENDRYSYSFEQSDTKIGQIDPTDLKIDQVTMQAFYFKFYLQDLKLKLHVTFH